jgi:hypothetical protein
VYEVYGTIDSVCRKARFPGSETVFKRYLPRVHPGRGFFLSSNFLF